MINLPHAYTARVTVSFDLPGARVPKNFSEPPKPFMVKDLSVERIAERQVCGLKEHHSGKGGQGRDESIYDSPELKEIIDRLSQFADKATNKAIDDAAKAVDEAIDEANKDVRARLSSFYNYLAGVLDDQQLSHMIQVGGGYIVEQNEDFIVVRDHNENLYTVELKSVFDIGG